MAPLISPATLLLELFFLLVIECEFLAYETHWQLLLGPGLFIYEELRHELQVRELGEGYSVKHLSALLAVGSAFDGLCGETRSYSFDQI